MTDTQKTNNELDLLLAIAKQPKKEKEPTMKQERKKELEQIRHDILLFQETYRCTFVEALNAFLEVKDTLKGGMTHDEIGILMGTTRQRSKQIEDKALKILRHPANGKDFKAYIQMDKTGYSSDF